MKTDIPKTIEAYFSGKTDVVAVYIFGSHAAGRPRQTSDVDIALLFDSYQRSKNLAGCDAYVSGLSRKLRKVIHPVLMNSAGEEIVRQILSKGKCLVVNDATQLARYKMTMLSKIIDFTFLQSRMQRGFTRKLSVFERLGIAG